MEGLPDATYTDIKKFLIRTAITINATLLLYYHNRYEMKKRVAIQFQLLQTSCVAERCSRTDELWAVVATKTRLTNANWFVVNSHASSSICAHWLARAVQFFTWWTLETWRKGLVLSYSVFDLTMRMGYGRGKTVFWLITLYKARSWH